MFSDITREAILPNVQTTTAKCMVCKQTCSEIMSRSLRTKPSIGSSVDTSIAKAMLPAIYMDDGNAQRADHSPINGFEYKTPQGCAKEAVSLADALINELQKKGASNENN